MTRVKSTSVAQVTKLCVVAATLLLAVDIDAARAQGWGVRGAVDLGGQWFTASDSFTTVLGTDRATIAGLSGEAVLPRRIFASVRWSRFEEDGERVFIVGSETFRLGIDTTVRVTPVEITGGYRFAEVSRRLVPYIGAGTGWHRYEETSEFADAGENVDDTHRGYHILGGAEFRISRWLGVGGEFQWTTVPDALGQDPNSVSAEFDEDDLGGTAFRVKFVVGR